MSIIGRGDTRLELAPTHWTPPPPRRPCGSSPQFQGTSFPALPGASSGLRRESDTSPAMHRLAAFNQCNSAVSHTICISISITGISIRYQYHWYQYQYHWYQYQVSVSLVSVSGISITGISITGISISITGISIRYQYHWYQYQSNTVQASVSASRSDTCYTAIFYTLEHVTVSPSRDHYLFNEVCECGIGHSGAIMGAGAPAQLIQDHQ